ncbi:hypothetical protein [Halobaculum rubrum]|uniref:hypothetical protein n=1 Tax=Halobaculum rubrum TaxID=2872158 RepID=UPI001CA39D0D|nr:hypothetical protein [Halobaculum rubrum]QZY00745.1 hypothetical protein K6T25_06640 [Halobaculum rubrum]
MPLRNRAGDPVDPVPFLVVASLAFLLVFSTGPIYLQALFGVGLATALAGSTGVFLVVTAAAYHRFVRTDRPELRGEVPVEGRYRRLWYGAVALALLLALLSLPFMEL